MTAANQVRVLTQQPVTADDLPEEGRGSYREIYDEIRDRSGGESLRRFIARIGSAASPSYWSQYEADEKRLNWARKSELRKYVGMPPIPRPVSDVLDDAVDLDATVWAVGPEQDTDPVLADRVILIERGQAEPITLHINGTVEVVIPPTQPRPAVRRSLRRHVSISVELGRELDEIRRREGLTWEQFLGRLRG